MYDYHLIYWNFGKCSLKKKKNDFLCSLKLDGNCIKILCAVLNKSWKQHPQNSSCTATYHHLTNLGLLHVHIPVLADLQKLAFIRFSIDIECHVKELKVMADRDGSETVLLVRVDILHMSSKKWILTNFDLFSL